MSTQPLYLNTRVTLYCCEVGDGVCHAEADHAVAVGAVADGEEGGGGVIHCCLRYSFTSGLHVDTDLFVLFTLQSLFVRFSHSYHFVQCH